jgi:hypothetical protein
MVWPSAVQLNGFVDRFEGVTEQSQGQAPGAGDAFVPRGSALEPVVAFLTALQADDANGRVVVQNTGAFLPEVLLGCV